jgi:hypothetical protein
MNSTSTAPMVQPTANNLADVLERILDKGIIILGDIRVRLVDIELLSLQIRLVISSLDKAREMGLDWWNMSPVFSAPAKQELPGAESGKIEDQKQRAESGRIEDQKQSESTLIKPEDSSQQRDKKVTIIKD